MTNILYPVFGLVAWTFFIAFWMAKERVSAYRRGDVGRPNDGGRINWTGKAAQISNVYHNLVEMPVLFYAVVAFAMLTDGDDVLMILLAWLYVVFRLIQGIVHSTYNNRVHRFYAFAVSVVVLLVMWLKLFLHVSSASVI